MILFYENFHCNYFVTDAFIYEGEKVLNKATKNEKKKYKLVKIDNNNISFCYEDLAFIMTISFRNHLKYILNWPYLPNPSARAGYDTRSIFKRSLTGLNSEFSFS